MVIIDASVVCKAVLPEENREKIKSIFKKHVEGIDKVTIPNLLFYEVANTLATKSAIPKSQMIKSLEGLGTLRLSVYDPSLKEIGDAAIFAKDNYVSVYDAIYVILALNNKCDLITADKKFARQVNLPFVKTLEEI